MFSPKTELSLAQCCMANIQLYKKEEEQWGIWQTDEKILCHDDSVGGKPFSFSVH